MKRNDNERLTDVMLGEAILALLHGGRTISASSVINRLKILSADEHDEPRRLACERAIAEVHNSISANRERTTVQVRDGDNVPHLFTNDGPQDDTQQH